MKDEMYIKGIKPGQLREEKREEPAIVALGSFGVLLWRIHLWQASDQSTIFLRPLVNSKVMNANCVCPELLILTDLDQL